MPCSHCRRDGHTNSKKKPCTLEPLVPKDPVTPEALRTRYNRLREFENAEIADDKKFGYDTRRNGLPEHISENVIKEVIKNHLGDRSCTWMCNGGDLYSNESKVIECKSFTSKGPTSFGPKQKWNVIYFLDARDWLDDKLIVWQINLPNTHDVWKNIKVKESQTKEDQADEGRRPRINWNGLYPQISEHCTKVYEGTFEGIFIPVVKEVVAEQSVVLQELTQHSLPVCTDENQPMQESYTPPEIPEN
jgi:hypothetical protein